MRIAMVTDQYLPQIGGVADSIAILEKGLRAEGHEVQIYAPNLPKSVPDSNVVRLPTLTLYGDMFNFVAPLGLTRMLRSSKPDVVHAQAVGLASLAAVLAARRLRIPLVGTCHGFPSDYLKYFYLDVAPIRYLADKATAWFFDACDAVTAPTQAPLDKLRDCGMTKPRHEAVVSNAIDLAMFTHMSDKGMLKEKYNIPEKALLFFGRLAREKNFSYAIDLFGEIALRTDATLIVVGDGPDRAVFEAEIKAHGLEARTKMMGFRRGAELVEIINACDVLCVTGLLEAQAMTILQAMQCGLPTVGLKAGGVAEVIEDDVTGYLIEPSDCDGFVNRCVELLNNPLLRQNFGEAAREQVQLYSPQHIARQFVTVYEKARGR
jgi:glycosyltransferase involved in cell wall biosynthesis